MNSFCLPLIVIIALIGVILIYICKLRDKSDITPDIKQDVETGEIDDLFNNTVEEVNTHLPQKIKQKEFRVILKNKGWWKRNNPFIGGMCAISFIAILMLVLSGVTHRKYNTQQEISIQKEHQKKKYTEIQYKTTKTLYKTNKLNSYLLNYLILIRLSGRQIE